MTPTHWTWLIGGILIWFGVSIRSALILSMVFLLWKFRNQLQELEK